MKNLIKVLPFLAILSLAFLYSCKDDDPTPSIEKVVKIEIEFSGSYENYLTTFSMLNLFSGVSDQVSASLISPNVPWTQEISAANTYSYTVKPDFSTLIAQSDGAVKSSTFVFQATHDGSTPTTDFMPLTATIKVYGDNSLVKTFSYSGPNPGTIAQSLTETVSF